MSSNWQHFHFVDLRKQALLQARTTVCSKTFTCWHVGDNIKTKVLKYGWLKIDNLCFEWFVKAKSQNIPVSGSFIKEKVKQIAGQLGAQTFSASNRWKHGGSYILVMWRLKAYVRNQLSLIPKMYVNSNKSYKTCY